MLIRAVSAPNIALIKYWGNRNDELRLPAADSLSITLDSPTVEVRVEASGTFSVRSFRVEGTERILSDHDTIRFVRHFTQVQQYVQEKYADADFPPSVAIEIRSKIPASVGLASSAAVFSALAEVYAGFVPGISRSDVSVMARLGSGSASRSVYGGYVAMVAGQDDVVGASYAKQIAPETYWKLHDVIIVPSHDEKKIGSTEGHALAHTSPLFEARLREMPRRQQACIDAILNRDFDTLRVVSEEDCMDMHAVMHSSNPSLDYLTVDTHRIVSEIQTLRSQEKLNVLYTMDAGPTVHLICDEASLPRIRAFVAAQKGCTVFEAGIGTGSHRI